MMRESDMWSGAVALPGIAVDHIGIVVPSCDAPVALLRGLGFQVSDPEPLMGADGPLGQTSAHCVFANAYLEISAPDPDSGNHLLPLLAMGQAIRIMVLRSDDCAADHARLQKQGIAAGPVRAASRTVRLPGKTATARFSWFPVAGMLQGVLLAMAQHHDRDLVFAPALQEHPNGARRVHDVLMGPDAAVLTQPASVVGDAPQCLIAASFGDPIIGLTVSGVPGLRIEHPAFTLRGTA